MLLLCVCVCVYVLLCVCWDGCFSNWNFPLHPDFSIKILKVLVQKCKIRYEKSEARQTNSCTHSHSDADTHSHIADENERMRWVSKHFSWGITLEFFILWGEQVWIKQTFHSILFIHSFIHVKHHCYVSGFLTVCTEFDEQFIFFICISLQFLRHFIRFFFFLFFFKFFPAFPTYISINCVYIFIALEWSVEIVQVTPNHNPQKKISDAKRHFYLFHSFFPPSEMHQLFISVCDHICYCALSFRSIQLPLFVWCSQ